MVVPGSVLIGVAIDGLRSEGRGRGRERRDETEKDRGRKKKSFGASLYPGLHNQKNCGCSFPSLAGLLLNNY